jgi:hypothetical protein
MMMLEALFQIGLEQFFKSFPSATKLTTDNWITDN